MENQKREPWGYHLLMDCAEGDNAAIQDPAQVSAFLVALVKAIDMVAYGDPFIERFATHDEDKAGISCCQMIETSNITGHFVEKNGDFYIDIFSCKPFDQQVAVDVVKKYFAPKAVQTHFVERDARRLVS